MGTPARLRRTYFDCRFGQLHVHQAIPPGGGFDEATALLCLPGAPGLGSFFSALLAPLGNNRSVYAPDLPGFGGSDPVPGVTDADQWAWAMADLLDSLRQRQVDVLAQDAGLPVALALVAQRPGLVRRIGCSAGSPGVLARVRQCGVVIKEFSLAEAGAATISASPMGSQVNDLIEFFGAGIAT